MQAADGQRIHVQEVSARDGFQIEPAFIATAEKIAYVDQLSRTGLAKIEVTAFVSPGAVPNMADADEVLRSINRVAGVEYAVLVPNLRGCERALAIGADELNVVMSASEAHNLANLRKSCTQSLVQIAAIARQVEGATRINVSLSTAFGCPFEGDIPLDRVFELLDRIEQMGIESVSLCDTTGMANPAQVEHVFARSRSRWPRIEFTGHFHNTRGMGLANVLAALEAGVRRFDSSLGGLGGCPFAPGATGNVCTEDLVHMLQTMGYDTRVSLDALLSAAMRLPSLVGHDVPSQLLKAGPSTRRYPAPVQLERAGATGSSASNPAVSPTGSQ